MPRLMAPPASSTQTADSRQLDHGTRRVSRSQRACTHRYQTIAVAAIARPIHVDTMPGLMISCIAVDTVIAKGAAR